MQRLAQDQAADGERALVVALELTMTLFCVLYAYPHVPSVVLDTGTGATSTWFAVATPGALRAALLHLLRQSEVMQSCAAGGPATLNDLLFDDLGDANRLDAVFGLRLGADNVPVVCRQMFQAIAALLRAVGTLTDVGTRDALQRLYQKYQFLPMNVSAGARRVERPDRAELLRFCSEQAVGWLQPYFGSHPRFFQPRGLGIACA